MGLLSTQRRMMTLDGLSAVSMLHAGVGEGGVAAWYLSGGIASGDVVAAYQPKGAASLAASYVNIANSGTRDAELLTGAPDWSAALGWVGQAGCSGLYVGDAYVTAGNVASVVVRTVGLPAWSALVWADPTANTLSIRGRAAGLHAYYIGGTTSGDCTTGASPTLALISNDGAAEEYAFLNGVEDATAWTANSVANGQQLRCGPTTVVSWSVAAVVWYGVRITPAQAIAVSTAMAAL